MTFDNLITASKRAKHFGMAFDGPFSVTGSTGACIAARNYAMLLDARDGRTAQDVLDDIVILDSWARSINKLCDAKRIAGDPLAQAAFSSFLSRHEIAFERLQ